MLNKTNVLLLRTITFAICALCLAVNTQAKVTDLGVIWNDDGDLAVTHSTPLIAADTIEFTVDLVAGTAVKTLTYSVGAGSDILLYPTKVASTWGWRKTPYDDHPKWGPRIRRGRELIEKDFDAVRAAGERAKKHGMFFYPSYRMNDAHFVFKPDQYPLTGKFWVDNRNLTIKHSGKSPSPSVEAYSNLLNFEHEKVRNYRIDILKEITDRYSDIMDGIELDFTRSFFFFPFGKGPEKKHLITEMITNLRDYLDRSEKENGKEYYIIVRVASTIDNNIELGLDVPEWIRKELVDVVTPTQLMTTAYEMPVNEFKELTSGTDCLIYPGLYPRVGWEWPYEKDPDKDTYYVAPTREILPRQFRAVVANYWHQGADGMYLYNFRCEPGFRGPYEGKYYQMIRDAARPECLRALPKLFSVSKGYYLDHEGIYSYKKQLSTEIKSGILKQIKIMVGDNIRSQNTRLKINHLGLRLGFVNLDGDDRLYIALNGKPFYSGKAQNGLLPVQNKAKENKSMSPGAEAFWQKEISDHNMIITGWNTVDIKVDRNRENNPPVLTDVNIAADYYNDLYDMLFN